MGAVGETGVDDACRDRQATGEAAPFRDVRLDIGNVAAGDHGVERVAAAQVLARGEHDRRGIGEGQPFVRRAVAGQGFLDPGEAEFVQLRGQLHGGHQIPALVHVDHQLHAAAQRVPKGAQVGEVARGVEADLELEGRVSLGPFLGGDDLGRAGIDAAGVDRHGAVPGAAAGAV